ncbi:MAG TPA: hypothetical protein VEZ71_29945 [Archangium sp.]|nr:hypothetical protein [Archangium sp.]
MSKTMKKTLAVLASLALAPAALAETRVGSPIHGTVTATTYYSSGSFHGAVDITNSGVCNAQPVRAPFPGYWNVIIRTTGVYCYGNGSGNQNEARHAFADGWTFAIWHFIKTADSYSRTCTTNCNLGNLGGTGSVSSPLVHMQQTKSGTHDTSWYSGYTTKGEFLDAGETVGYL